MDFKKVYSNIGELEKLLPKKGFFDLDYIASGCEAKVYRYKDTAVKRYYFMYNMLFESATLKDTKRADIETQMELNEKAIAKGIHFAPVLECRDMDIPQNEISIKMKKPDTENELVTFMPFLDGAPYNTFAGVRKCATLDKHSMATYLNDYIDIHNVGFAADDYFGNKQICDGNIYLLDLWCRDTLTLTPKPREALLAHAVDGLFNGLECELEMEQDATPYNRDVLRETASALRHTIATTQTALSSFKDSAYALSKLRAVKSSNLERLIKDYEK